MERNLKQKTFSDVIQEAIKQRWGTKRRKTPLVNFPGSTKKAKVQLVGYSTSQQYDQGTSIADHEPFSHSQPIISEKKLSFGANQTVRGWKPPLKRYQDVFGRNVTDVNSLKLLENNSGSEGYTDGNNFKENYAPANSVNCEAKSSENVPHEVNSVLLNSMEETKHENKDGLGSASLVLKDGAGSAYQDITQRSNIQQCIKPQYSPASTDSAAHASTSDCIQSSIFDKEAEMENPTSLDQASNDSKEYDIAIQTVNDNNSSILIKDIANSEVLSNINTETDFRCADKLSFSQRSTQLYVASDNITHEENTVIDEEEIEELSDDCEEIPLSPKANIFKQPSYMTNDIHNVAINAFHIASNAESEDAAKDVTSCLAESILTKNVSTAEEEKLLPGKEVQDTLDSKGFKEFLKEGSSKSSMLSPIIFKSQMAQRENITYANGCVSGESTVMINGTNSMEGKNTNKECEKDFCFQIKPGTTQTIEPQSCAEISTHADVCASTDKHSESKTLLFDAKKYSKDLESKFQNIFNFENHREETLAKENISVSNNNEKPPLTNMNTTPADDFISEKSTVMINGTNSMEGKNTNKECEKDFCFHIKPGTTQTIKPQLCDEVSTHADDVYTSTEKCGENKTFLFDAKQYSKALESKFQNVFNFENYMQETLAKENISVFDSNEKPPLTNMNTTSEQDTQMKISENHNACVAAAKLSQDSNAHQKSEDTSASIIKETKTDKSKDGIIINTATCDGSSVAERTCEPIEYTSKQTEHTAEESFNKEVTKADYGAVVLSAEAANLQMTQSTLRFNDGDQNIKSLNNTKPLDAQENVVLPAVERKNDIIVPHETEPLAENTNMEEKTINYQQILEVTCTASRKSTVNNDGKIHSEDKEKNELTVFKVKINSQSNDNAFVSKRETLTENNSETNKFNKCQRNINLESETINSGNKFGSEPAITNSETSHAFDEKRAYIVDLKLTKENLVEESGTLKIEKYVDEIKANHSRNDGLKDEICFNSNTKKVKPPNTDLADQISVSDIEVLSNSKTEQHPLKNETENKTGNLILTDNKESAHIQFKNSKQPENKNSFLIPDIATNNEVAARNSNTDFPEMEDDFGLTVSQILRIEDECQQKMFVPEMPSIQWAQKVKESRRKVQAVIQQMAMLNAMLKKARKEVWQPPSDATAGEGTSAPEGVNTFLRPTTHRWNRNLNSKFRQNMQRK